MDVLVFKPADANHVTQAFAIYERWRRAQGLPPVSRPVVRVAVDWPPQARTGQDRPETRRVAEMPQDGPMPLLLAEAHAAHFLGCSTRTVRRRAAEGKLHPVRDGGLKRYRRDEIEAFARGLGQET